MELGDEIGESAHRRVLAAFGALHNAGIPALLDVTPAYASIQLTFDPALLDVDAAEARARQVLAGLGAAPALPPSRLIEIPVCYEGEFAPDLAEVAAMHALAVEDVVRLHSGAAYTVHFLGFSPGFPYLTGLPERLATPRLDSPRPRIAAGSVGLAGMQTGVYPHATPGGWRIIGRTPLSLFDPMRAAMSLLAIGDPVRFIPIAREAFDRLQKERR